MVGYVPQELGLFHDPVLANVTLGDPAISEEAVVKAPGWRAPGISCASFRRG